MSTNGRGGGIAHSGFRTLTAGLLLAAAVWGLYNLESQIQVFGFGASGVEPLVRGCTRALSETRTLFFAGGPSPHHLFADHCTRHH